MTRKQPTSSRGGRKYGENTMARRPDLRGQESDSGSEEPRRLALVPTGDLQGPADGLLLGIRCGPLADFPQRGTDRRRLSAECGLRSRQMRVAAGRGVANLGLARAYAPQVAHGLAPPPPTTL